MTFRKWQIVNSDIANEACNLDDGKFGWRIGVTYPHRGVLTIFTLPCRFMLKGDCERAAEWMNVHCPPQRDIRLTVTAIEKRFKTFQDWKQEIIPIACRF
jgi:hypothetical protein